MELTPYQRLELFWQSKRIKNASGFADTVPGLTAAALSAMKKRGSMPSAPVMRHIQVAYPDISPDYILFGEGTMLRGGRALTPADHAKMPDTIERETLTPGDAPGHLKVVRLSYEELLAENAELHRQLKASTGQVVEMLTEEVKRLRKPLTSSEAADLRQVANAIAAEIPAALYEAPGFKWGIHRKLA